MSNLTAWKLKVHFNYYIKDLNMKILGEKILII